MYVPKLIKNERGLTKLLLN